MEETINMSLPKNFPERRNIRRHKAVERLKERVRKGEKLNDKNALTLTNTESKLQPLGSMRDVRTKKVHTKV